MTNLFSKNIQLQIQHKVACARPRSAGKRRFGAQSGQMVVEGLLLMTLLLGATSFFYRSMRDRQVLASLVEKPWSRLAGMTESGVWDEPGAAARSHPNQKGRLLSLK